MLLRACNAWVLLGTHVLYHDITLASEAVSKRAKQTTDWIEWSTAEAISKSSFTKAKSVQLKDEVIKKD